MNEYAFSPTLLLDIVAKVGLLLLVVALGSLFIRKCSAAVQHCWWTLGFVACLLTPVASLVTPTWTLPIIPKSAQVHDPLPVDRVPVAESPGVSDHGPIDPAGSIVGIAQQTYPTRPQAQQPTAPTGPPITSTEQPSIVPKETTAPVVTTSMQTEVAQKKAFPWTQALMALWGIGAVAVWLRSAWQHVLLRRMLSRCAKLQDAGWHSLLSNSSHLLGVRGKVELLERKGSHSPLSAGVWRPVVVLPKQARNWSHKRRHLVLLHELAHVARRDVLKQSLAGMACGLYWFNLLAWYGLFQMRKLRELACDDLVLSCGQKPSGYADVLLDIARSHRHQAYSTAVGMAHNNHVEDRILAILDKTRRHVALSRPAARALYVSAAALVCLVGTAQLRTQAESADAESTDVKSTDVVAEDEKASGEKIQDKPIQDKRRRTAQPESATDDPQSTAESNTDDNLRTMRIRILDDQGKPLAGALLTAGVWYPDGYEGFRTPKQQTADANGIVMLRLPKRLRILRLWPKQPGYIGEFKNFAKGTHREGELIPDEFEFRLSMGHPIGGRVVDEKGNPIEGVHVRVRVDNAPGMASTWLTDSFGQPTVKTDAQGRWQLRNAPAPLEGGTDCSFVLKLSHDDYITDERWGDSQRAQGIGASDLRSGDAKIVLYRGSPIDGLVTDLEGKPITKGWVVWSDEPYFNDGVFEAELQPGGQFRTPPLADGEYPITIVAPGFAAQRRVIQVSSQSRELRFELRPGKRITIRVVDTAGRPVPNVGIYLASSSVPNTWQRSNALHNHKHPNVPDYGIPRRTDERGLFVWDWAPEEPVTYSVGAKGFAPQEITLVAKEDPHVITLAGARVATGLVTDAVTGRPIKQFQAMPVIVFRPNFFSTRYADRKRGTNGRYELPLTGSGDPNDRYRVRIEADGYRSLVSEKSFGPKDGRVALDVQLQPVPVRKGRVVDAKGEPVVNAKVMEGTPTWVPTTRNGEPDSYGERIIQTDSDGRFVLNATSEPVRVRVIHKAGMVEKLLQPEEGSIGDLQLEPWAKISGRLVQNGKPMGNEAVFFNPLVRRGLGAARFQDSYYAMTAPDGTFSFDRLPPGAGSLRPNLGPWRDSPLTSGESLSLKLKAGDNLKVVLGGDGAVLTGQVVATGRDEVALNRKWSLNYLISRDRGVAPPYPADFPRLSFDPSTPIQLSWSLDPHFSDWVATRENHFVKLTPDGRLHVTGVAPGNYDLVICLYEQPAGCLVETVGEKIIPVRVGGREAIDLGRIEVPCRVGPRPGSDMRAFDFVDTSGKKQSVNDMAGRYVLMHVWASWCTPCLESMPDIRHTADNAAAQPVTFVGLNIDGDVARAKELAEQMNCSWSQNYLGEDSDMARQLAISSVPTYYLIGPDGKLAASATEWTAIKKQLLALLANPAD